MLLVTNFLYQLMAKTVLDMCAEQGGDVMGQREQGDVIQAWNRTGWGGDCGSGYCCILFPIPDLKAWPGVP